MQLRGQATALAQNSVELREPRSGRSGCGLAGCVTGKQGLIRCRPGAVQQVPAHEGEGTKGS